MIHQHLQGLIAEALDALQQEKILTRPPESEAAIERPARPEHGDFSSNIALALAGQYGIPSRQLAERIIERLPSSDHVAKVEVAGPGFINFYLSRKWLYETVVAIAEEKEKYGRSDYGQGVKIQVEYGSANPTGPIHVGNARNIAYGDALASVLEQVGYSVQRENYINDMGGQMERFAVSLEARYLQALGHDAELPEDGYQGDYLIDLGKELAEAEGMGLIGKLDEIREWGLAKMVDAQQKTLKHFGVVYDNWFFESSLHTTGKIEQALERLRGDGHLYEADGATWFRATALGHGQDRVVIKSSEKGGNPTYLAADTAYLIDKLERGFEQVIYFWGADHHGTVENLMAVARALGVAEQVEVLIYQFVTFTGGRLGRRSGRFITLDEMIDEVGADAARFTFLTRGPESTMVFDFDLVKSQSQENPVYYVQYAHARICSILRYGREGDIKLGSIDKVDLTVLVHEAEHDLIRKLAEYPEVVELSAKLRAPYRIAVYAQELAAQFHAFYRDCRVIGEDPDLTQARLWLAEDTRQVLANALAILGVGAPESM